MKKVTIEFDEGAEAVLALNVIDFWGEIDDLRDLLRSHLKYGQETTIEEVYSLVCAILERYKLP